MKKENQKPAYILCPRCELNYITKKDRWCKVCLAEMGLEDKSFLLTDEEDVERICPVCKINILGEDEEICFVCQKEKVPGDEEEEREDVEKVWVEFEDEDKTLPPDDIISLDEAFEEEEKSDELFEDDEHSYQEPDDFDYDVDPADFEDYEEEEEEEDDLP